jgi:lipocalin-like protein
LFFILYKKLRPYLGPVMEHNPQPQAAAGPEQYSQGGYEASFGTYVIDEGSHTFTFHVEGALVRTLTGKDLPRSFEFSGKQLLVKSTRQETPAARSSPRGEFFRPDLALRARPTATLRQIAP